MPSDVRSALTRLAFAVIVAVSHNVNLLSNDLAAHDPGAGSSSARSTVSAACCLLLARARLPLWMAVTL